MKISSMNVPFSLEAQNFFKSILNFPLFDFVHCRWDVCCRKAHLVLQYHFSNVITNEITTNNEIFTNKTKKWEENLPIVICFHLQYDFKKVFEYSNVFLCNLQVSLYFVLFLTNKSSHLWQLKMGNNCNKHRSGIRKHGKGTHLFDDYPGISLS